MHDVDVVVVSAWHFVIGGAGLSTLAFIREGAPSVIWTPRFIATLAFLGLVGTAGAFVLWFTEVQRAPLAAVTLWTFLTPVFGLTFSAVALREYPSGREVAGIALVLAGLAGGLARAARDPRNENDRLRPGPAEDAPMSSASTSHTRPSPSVHAQSRVLRRSSELHRRHGAQGFSDDGADSFADSAVMAIGAAPTP